MDRVLLTLALVAGCGGAERAIYSLPEGVTTALAVHADEVRVLDRSSTFTTTDDGRPLTLLMYAEPLDALLLEVDDEGRLVTSDDPEDAWPLLPPREAVRFDNEARAFTALEDAGAALAATILVPPPPCGALRVVESERPSVDLAGVHLHDPVLVDDVLMFASAGPTARQPPRLFRVANGETRELTSDLTRHRDAAIRIFPERDAFTVVQTSTTITVVYEIALDGTLTSSRAVATTGAFSLADVQRAPGTRGVFARDARSRTLARLDLDTGAWRLVHDGGPSPPDSPCSIFLNEQHFSVDADGRAIAGFIEAPTRRHDGVGAPEPVLGERGAPRPCHTSYARFASGAEMMLEVLGLIGGSGLYDIKSHWRAASSEPWREASFSAQIWDLEVSGERAVGIDGQRDDVTLLTRDARRPDRPPRLCDRLGIANVGAIALDGDRGVAFAREAAPVQLSIVRFAIE